MDVLEEMQELFGYGGFDHSQTVAVKVIFECVVVRICSGF